MFVGAPCQPTPPLGRPTSVTSVLSETGHPRLEGPEGVRTVADSRADLALERLYHEHYLRLVRLGVLLLGGDVGRAEEVVQDAFVEVHRRWDRIEGAAVPAYLRQTVVNRCRSTRRHLRVVDRNRPEAPGPAPAADEPVLAGALRHDVLDALAGLPRRQREVLVLRYYLDLSEREIAETLQISQGSVKSHASRATAALRTALSGLLEES
jgi:RNA polymerase sigma-70 factor (sigma-E family)